VGWPGIAVEGVGDGELAFEREATMSSSTRRPRKHQLPWGPPHPSGGHPGPRGRRGPASRPDAGPLVAARLALGLTLVEMAARCGLAPSALSRTERGGSRRPKTDRIRRMADGYGLPAALVHAQASGTPADPARATEWLRGRAPRHRERVAEPEEIASEPEKGRGSGRTVALT
jgi:transcriptional regulator with XRE-family HTH domain